MLYVQECEPLRERLPLQREKEKTAREREDSRESATIAESLGTRQRSAPNDGAKEKAKAKGRRREKEEYGK